MTLRRLLLLSLLFSSLSFSSILSASDYGMSVFGGVGVNNKSGEDESSTIPFSVGFSFSFIDRFMIGMDISGEGTYRDYTSGRNGEISQAVAMNVIAGYEFFANRKHSFWVAPLLGGRWVEESCGDSYLGYRCYADQDPHLKTKLNYGVIIRKDIGRLFLGTRLSGESAQFIFGVNFMEKLY